MIVHVWRCEIAPRSDRWQACEDDYDLGVAVGSGATPLQAIEDLLWHKDIEDIAPQDVSIVWEC